MRKFAGLFLIACGGLNFVFFAVGTIASAIQQEAPTVLTILAVLVFAGGTSLVFAGPGAYLYYTARKREQAARTRENEAQAREYKRERLLGLVGAAGQVSLTEAMNELQMTRTEIRDTLFDLVNANRFAGYVDWNKQILYSKQAALVGSNKCPNCGSLREFVGKGIVKCPYCGVELFIPSNT